MTKAHCALNLPPNARSSPETISPEQKDSNAEQEDKQENEVAEATVDAEKDTSQVQSVPKIITENGVVGSSEFWHNF